jgi:hypothetical protein
LPSTMYEAEGTVVPELDSLRATDAAARADMAADEVTELAPERPPPDPPPQAASTALPAPANTPARKRRRVASLLSSADAPTDMDDLAGGTAPASTAVTFLPDLTAALTLISAINYRTGRSIDRKIAKFYRFKKLPEKSNESLRKKDIAKRYFFGKIDGKDCWIRHKPLILINKNLKIGARRGSETAILPKNTPSRISVFYSVLLA